MWFVQLPLPLQLTIIITVVLVIIGLSLIGKVNLRLGLNRLTFGKSEEASKVIPITSQNCSHCRKLIMSRTMKFDADIEKVRNSILRDQMNYTEQKIQEISFKLSSSYREDIIRGRIANNTIDQVRENKEYILYQEALGNAMFPIRNEARRSFKENGFVEMRATEFQEYVRSKTNLLITMVQEYIRSRYPFENMIVNIQDRFNQTPDDMIEHVVLDVYTNAKQVALDAEEKMFHLGKEFDQDMEEICK